MASFSERYHQLTKYNPHTIDKLGAVRWDSQPPPFKSIHSQEKIDLISRLKFLAVTPDQETGATGRESASDAPGLDAIARLLFYTLGITARLSDQGGGDFFLRAAPSAGGLYPTEVYVAARNQQGLPDGLYHYHSLKSALIPVWQGAFWADLRHYFLGQAIEASDLIFLFTGLYGRSAWRYKERAYRRILLDTGHALGNLLEACRALGLDYALMGGFLDEGLEELLFLAPKEEFPLMGVAVGPPGSLPPGKGQYPGEVPADAVRRLVPEDPMQVQQNSCERIRAPEGLRPPVAAACPGPVFPVADPSLVLKVILRRRSCRKFSGEAVTLERAREILAFAFRREGNGWCLAAGQMDFHLVALKVDGLDPGVYRLDPATLSLEPKRPGDFQSEAYFICLGQELASECAFLLLHTADLAALAETFGDRGYRYACMDAGQIGERVNLWAVQLGLGSSGIGGYYDDQANGLLQLPLSHGILYITLVGVPEGE